MKRPARMGWPSAAPPVAAPPYFRYFLKKLACFSM
jgi:hypothetical protein